MKSFEIRRLNMNRQTNFALRGHESLSQSLYSNRTLEISVAPLAGSPVETTSIIQLFLQLIAQSAMIAFLIAAPIAEAHAAAKKKKKPVVVNIVFDVNPAGQAPLKAKSQDAATNSDVKITRTLRPVDRYADDSAEADVAADINDGIEPETSQTIAVMLPKIKRAPRADAGITEEVLNEASQDTNADYPMMRAPAPTKEELQMNSDIDITEEYY